MLTRLELLLALGATGLIAAILLPSAPINMWAPERDSGLFLYGASHLLQGQVPYRDIWDHKPPGIFLLDALGLFIAGGSFWGVWLIECLFLLFAVVAGYVLLQSEFGRVAAVAGSLAWIISLPLVLEGGNLTQEYALTFQFCVLLLLRHQRLSQLRAPRLILVGIAAGFVFLLQQNLIGLWLSVVVLLALQQFRHRAWQRLAEQLVLIGAGAAAPVGLCLLWLTLTGALGPFWDAAFRYNASYIGVPLMGHLIAVAKGIVYLAPAGFPILAFGGWIVAARIASTGAASTIVKLMLLDFPIEVLLSSIAGYESPHYYIPWLPSLAIATALAVNRLTRLALSSGSFRHLVAIRWVGAIAAGLITVVPITRVVAGVEQLRTTTAPAEAAALIDSMTDEHQPVLIWGAEAGTLFLAHRSAPTRFVYQYALGSASYRTPDMAAEFLAEVNSAGTPVLIDAAEAPWLPRLEPGATSDAYLADVIQKLTSHYTPSKLLSSGWRVFTLKRD